MTEPDVSWPLELLTNEELQVEIDAALTVLIPLVTYYGFQHPARDARQLLCILNTGKWANAEAGWRREWLPEIAQFQSALAGMIERAENAPFPVVGCPSFAEFVQHAELLQEEVATLSDGYSQTSWVTRVRTPCGGCHGTWLTIGRPAPAMRQRSGDNVPITGSVCPEVIS